MAAPVLSHKKFYIVKPAEGTNYIKNPRFDPPDGVEDWAASGAGVTLALSGDKQRHGAYSMRVNTALSVASGAYYANLSVTNGVTYTFSVDVLGVQGQAMRIYIANSSGTAKKTTTFTATGYWQRVSVSFPVVETVTTYRVYVVRDAIASTLPFYVDGAQFEQASKATTFIHGYEPGCRWTGAARNSSSYRPGTLASGGELVDLEDYCEIVSVTGLGHGDWNQILTKMTSGGDMYQTHIRKSRNFSIVVDFIGDTLGEIEANRAAIVDLIRPDLAEGQTRIIRYQGVDDSGIEATNPVDIVCVPLSNTLVDTPDKPNHQRDVLNFSIPSGLLQGAYNEGKELDLYAEFPAEFIVKRDKDGNWCKWTGSAYQSLITGLNNNVSCMAEGPDGKIYVGGSFTDAGGVAGASRLARWNPATETWETVVTTPAGSSINALAFDAAGDLYVGGSFVNLGSANGDGIVKISNLNGTPTIISLGTGLSGGCDAIAINPEGYVYAGGAFTDAGDVANTLNIAKWNGMMWSPLATGLNNTIYALSIAPNGDLYVGGAFTDAAYPRLCKWNGTAFSSVGVAGDINNTVFTLDFDASGNLYAGGDFTNTGGIANADYIAKWNGNQWESLGIGANGAVHMIKAISGRIYAGGLFTSIGELTLTDRVAIWFNGAWQPLDIDLPGIEAAYFILPASDGSLYIGGRFSTAGSSGENAKTGLVALNLNVTSASANTYPFIQIHGPGTLKAITNYSTGKSVMFNGLTLQAGEWINLSFDPLNLQFKGGWAGRGNLMRYVVPGSDYGDFYLKPGSNSLSLFMTDTDANTNAWITWTPLFWGLDGALL